jgi:hypothetical protein
VAQVTNDGQGHKVFNSNNVKFTKVTMKNNFWILDGVASCHYFRSVEGLTEVKEIDESTKYENGDSMKATKIENLKCEATQINGEKLTVTINDAKYVLSLCVNLSSLNIALNNGFKDINNGVIVSLNYNPIKLTFDRMFNATDVYVTGFLMKPITFININ